MQFFDGLYPYEIVMLALGVFLFLVLILAFVMLVMRGQPYGKLFMFFVLPIVMVGFPGVKSFEISRDLFKIEKYTRDLEKDPTDKSLRESLKQEVANVSDRPLADPRASTTIARAQLALGHEAAAVTRVEKALEKAPQLPAALELKKRIELNRDLSTLTSQVEQNPGDAGARTKLAATVGAVTQLPVASPKTMVTIARAQEVLGEQARARSYVDRALTIEPNLAPAIRLRGRIEPNPVPIVPPHR